MRPRARLRGLALTLAAALAALPPASATAETPLGTPVDVAAPPAAPGAREPALATLPDGRLALTWTEPAGAGHAVRLALLDADGWGPARTVVAAPDLFVNWADFPSVAAFADGTLAVHWLAVSGASPYAYDAAIALSSDEGASWTAPLLLHDDRSAAQHGFVTLLPRASGDMLALWLDARAYDAGAKGPRSTAFDNAMQLRARTLSPAGARGPDTALDLRTCTCCQTAAAETGDGAVLVAYRDRTMDEIRDIAILRFEDGLWSNPVPVHADGWQISGCPINGPAIAARGTRVLVAWFTEGGGAPAVLAAFSEDGGRNFTPPFRLDTGSGVGRVDALMTADGAAVVAWVEWTDEGEALFLCRVRPGAGCTAPKRVALNTAPGSVGFPRMAGGPGGLYLAWTQPTDDPAAPPDRDTAIRILRLPF